VLAHYCDGRGQWKGPWETHAAAWARLHRMQARNEPATLGVDQSSAPPPTHLDADSRQADLFAHA
jgi:hypothetical protein